jgi:hypothetical protein
MSHRLQPHPGQPYLDPEEVARRLRDEFVCCTVDAEQGQDDVGDMLAKLIELKAPQAIIDDVIAGREQSLRVTVADEMASDDYLSFIVRPNEGPLIGYFSAQHEEATRPLVERCVHALGYEIVLV